MSSSSLLLDEINGEIALLESAYAMEVEDLRTKDCWKVARPPEIRVKIGLEKGALHEHIYSYIRIKTSDNYPNEAAKVTVESFNGLTNQQAKNLEEKLKNESKNYAKKATVSMMELCKFTENYLSDHAKPYTESIHAEMIANQKAKEVAIQLEREVSLKNEQKEEEKQIIIAQSEIERVQGCLKEEVRLRKEKIKSGGRLLNAKERRSSNSESIKSPKRCSHRTSSECSTENESSVVNFIGAEEKELQVKLQSQLGERRSQNCIVEVGQVRGSKELCVVYSWLLHRQREKKKLQKAIDHRVTELITKLNSVWKDVASVLRVPSHPNLVAFRGFKLDQPDSDCVHLHLVQEYVKGITLRFYLDQKLSLGQAFLQRIAVDILEALSFLHKHNIAHRNLRDTCVIIDDRTDVVRVADYFIERHCVEAVTEFQGEDPPSVYPQSPGRKSKKCDIFRLGVLLLSLFKAERVYEVMPNLPSGIGSDFRSFLNHCLEISEHDRWSAKQLKKHPFIHGTTTTSKQDDKQDKSSTGTSEEEDQDSSDESSTDEDKGAFNLPSHCMEYSRFCKEYGVMAVLGKGGFGRVYKVRNTIDSRIYAVKHIRLQHRSELKRLKTIREVTLLSSLNHENVVRYFTSWIENWPEDENSKSKTTNSSQEGENLTENEEYSSNSLESNSDEEKDWLMPNLKSLLCEEDKSDFVYFESPNLPDKEDEVDAVTNIVTSTRPESPLTCPQLFIQMEYCEKSTLRRAIDRNMYLNEERVWRLFVEMTSGLDYIHAQGMIHRDLKPGNIFLDFKDHVKIGDFGLATVGFKANASELQQSVTEKPESNLTGLVGTTFYIAPEISLGLGKTTYSNKVDIYSLGIIFFEMNVPLSTGMERATTLSALRQSDIQFPLDIDIDDTMKELVKWLLNHDPSKRPTTGELIKSPLLPPPTEEKQKFMTALETKLQNERSQDFQDIHNLMFRPVARPMLEMTFEVDIPKLSRKQAFAHDTVRSIVSEIFRSHGGVCVPTPFYAPKGAFYNDKENIVSLMSKGGELTTAQFELRFPFARLMSQSDCKSIRRFNIDRVQRAHKTSGIHPTEIYECAFDIVGSKLDVTESCGRVVAIAQEILTKVSKITPSQILLKIGHMDLVKTVLRNYGVESPTSRTFSLLKDFRGHSGDLEYIGECLAEEGIARNSVEALKGYLVMSGSPEEVTKEFERTMTTSFKRKQLYSTLRRTLKLINDVVNVCKIMGVEFEICVQPMMVIDQHLYEGFFFRLLPNTGKHKSSFNILAQGGSFDVLIQQQKVSGVSSSKKCESTMSAVGISLPLERLIVSLELNKTLTSLLELSNQNQGQTLVEIFIIAIDQRQLENRVELCSNLRSENVFAEHGFASTMTEAENFCEEFFYVPHFLFLRSSDQIILRSRDTNSNHNKRVYEKKISPLNLLDCLLKLCKSSKGEFQTMPQTYRRESSKSFSTERSQISIEYVTRKQMKLKDLPRIEVLIHDLVSTCVATRWATVSLDDPIEVLAVDLDQKALLCLGHLDVDSTVKHFNESIMEIKSSFPKMKDSIDRIGATLSKKIFYSKKKQSVIVCFSIPSETLKRIL